MKTKDTHRRLAALLACGMALAAPAAADTSGLRMGTASTVEDDAYCFMNVLDWSELEAPHAYVLTSVDSASSLNAGAAFQVPVGTVHAALRGNLWAYEEDNEFRALFGRGSMGFLVDFRTLYAKSYTDEDGTGLTFTNWKSWRTDLQMGMNVSDLFSFVAGFGFGHMSGSYNGVSASGLILPDVSFTAHLRLLRTDRLTGTVLIPVEISYASVKGGDTWRNVAFMFGAAFKMQYEVSDAVTYGLYAGTPFTIAAAGASGDLDVATTWSPVLRNGLSCALSPNRVLVNIGLATSLPVVRFTDGDTAKSRLANSFYGGMSIYITPDVRLDACGRLAPADGISLSELWTQNFSLTLSAAF